MRKNEDGTLRKTKMKPSQTIDAKRGERLIIHTPGGGGYGTPPEKQASASSTSAANGVNGHAKEGLIEKIKQTVFHPIANGSLNAYISAGESSQ
jgi:5-oxoprolinase (ATP-hydrolysing)